MEKKEQIKNIIRDFHLRNPFDVVPRDIEVPIDTAKIITIIGIRRCGKTSILHDVINKLSEKVDKTRILFINFEDERLDLSLKELDLLVQGFRELYPEHDLSQCYFFFDEIQNVEGWEKFVRRVYDSVTKNIFLTGSNSKLLGSDIATSLRGRTLSFEVFPLSFKEYLRFNEIEIDLYSSSSRARIRNAQSQFLKDGGFPETIFLEERYRIPLLQEYFNVLLYKDLIERYSISNTVALKYFLKRLTASSTKQLSIHKIYNELKSINLKIGKNTLYDFLDYASSVYFGLVLYKYDPSLAARQLGEKKIYSVDTGLCNAIEYRFSEDAGKALENAVFLELRRKGAELFFLRSEKSECDFLMLDRGKVLTAIQVAYDISDGVTRKRELKGLIEACRRFDLAKGTIITAETLKEFQWEGIQVNMIPFYRFFTAAD